MRLVLVGVLLSTIMVGASGSALGQRNTCIGGNDSGAPCSSNRDSPGTSRVPGGGDCLTDGDYPKVCNPVPGAYTGPGEATGLVWCAGTKDCLSWTAVTDATEYRLYRGSLGSLPDLLTSNADSCRVATVTTTTEGSLSEVPDPCSVFWYLVVAANGAGEGPAGNATAGMRVLNAPSGLCQPTCAAEGASCNASGSCCSGNCTGTCAPACDDSPCGFSSSKCGGVCTDTSTDRDNCSQCGAVCSSNHITTPTCAGGICNGSCAGGFGDCNNNKLTDGCETGLQTDPDNCNACSASCSSSHMATRTCAGGACNGACAAGFGDCNNNKLTDGCEVDLQTDPDNCSACGTLCSSNHMATRTCAGGACNGACAAGFGDCNNNKRTDGCEVNVNSITNCGGCGLVCSTNHMATLSCSSGTCNGACAAGFSDCNNNKLTDGCEINTNTDRFNCGGCGIACSTNHMATVTCGGGICNGTCASGFANCDGNLRINGCETNTQTDDNNCGSCGHVCVFPTVNCLLGTCH